MRPPSILTLLLVMLSANQSLASTVCASGPKALQRAMDTQMPLALTGANCQQAPALLGTHTQICRLSFTYRAKEAADTFEAWSASLLACAGPKNAILSDQPVNHPDSYFLHRFTLPQGEVSLSLKDKAALGQTLVFIQINPANAP